MIFVLLEFFGSFDQTRFVRFTVINEVSKSDEAKLTYLPLDS